MMKKIVLVMTILLVGLLSACGTSETSLESLGLAEYDAESLLVGLDQGTVDVNDFAVSVYPNELKVLTEDEEFVLEMPKDSFYLSVAPYVTRTHDCFYHSATGCQGELVDADFHILITSDSGDVILDETYNSGTNGFVDLWLPKGIEGTMTISYDGLSVSQDVTTVADDAKTCETTMQLQ